MHIVVVCDKKTQSEKPETTQKLSVEKFQSSMSTPWNIHNQLKEQGPCGEVHVIDVLLTEKRQVSVIERICIYVNLYYIYIYSIQESNKYN